VEGSADGRGRRGYIAARGDRLFQLDHALLQPVALANELVGHAKRPARQRHGADSHDELR
jgi:hypothetical protein